MKLSNRKLRQIKEITDFRFRELSQNGKFDKVVAFCDNSE